MLHAHTQQQILLSAKWGLVHCAVWDRFRARRTGLRVFLARQGPSLILWVRRHAGAALKERFLRLRVPTAPLYVSPAVLARSQICRARQAVATVLQENSLLLNLQIALMYAAVALEDLSHLSRVL